MRCGVVAQHAIERERRFADGEIDDVAWAVRPIDDERQIDPPFLGRQMPPESREVVFLCMPPKRSRLAAPVINRRSRALVIPT